MAYKVRKVKMLQKRVRDAAGVLAAEMQPFGEKAIDLEVVLGYPTEAGWAVVKALPANSRQVMALKNSGFADVPANQGGYLVVEGANKPGIAADIGAKIAAAGVSLSLFSAGAVGNQFSALIGFNSGDDATKAEKALTAKDTKPMRKKGK